MALPRLPLSGATEDADPRLWLSVPERGSPPVLGSYPLRWRDVCQKTEVMETMMVKCLLHFIQGKN